MTLDYYKQIVMTRDKFRPQITRTDNKLYPCCHIFQIFCTDAWYASRLHNTISNLPNRTWGLKTQHPIYPVQSYGNSRNLKYRRCSILSSTKGQKPNGPSRSCSHQINTSLPLFSRLHKTNIGYYMWILPNPENGWMHRIYSLGFPVLYTWPEFGIVSDINNILSIKSKYAANIGDTTSFWKFNLRY